MKNYFQQCIFKRLNSLSTRSEIMVLMVCIILPLSALILYGVADRYWLLKKNDREDVLNLARGISDKQNSFVLHTTLLLKALGGAPGIRNRNWAECNSIMRDFHERFGSFYSNIHVATVDGKVVCSGVPTPAGEFIGDRKGFQHAVLTKKLVFGDMVRSRITGQMVLNARYPVLDQTGNVFAVISAQISTVQFGEMISEVALPQNSELLITSYDKTLTFYQPASADWLGKPIPDGALTQAMFSNRQGVVEATGLDGVARIYGYFHLKSGDTEVLRIAVGFPLDKVTSEINRYLLVTLTFVFLVIVLALAMAWFGVDSLVLRKVRVLVDTATRLSNGESSARTGLVYGSDELSHVAQAMDSMADELERTIGMLKTQATRDPLTSLYNRRYLEDCMRRELSTATRKGWQLGFIIADLDHFKRFNDTYGHQLGDQVLIEVAQTLVANVRSGDVVCRYGGEEFAIILLDTSAENAAARAEAIRIEISKIRVVYQGEDIGTITASFGVAIFPNNGVNTDELMHNADKALYTAKESGRNRVVLRK